MKEFELKETYTLEDVPALVTRLRDPERGCPWDAEQTHASIRQNFLEETCEAMDAMDRNCTEDIREELGDVLLQVALHAEMEREQGNAGIDEVSDALIKKLVYRHPHVFGEEAVSGSAQVLVNWENLKRTEKSQKTGADAIDAVPATLPALMKMQKMQKRAAYVGFDFPGEKEAAERLSRAAAAVDAGAPEEQLSLQLAEVLYDVIAVARKRGMDAELILTRACERFAEGFRRTEERAAQTHTDMKDAPAQTLEELWNGAQDT